MLTTLQRSIFARDGARMRIN